jgi:hypothetical protein
VSEKPNEFEFFRTRVFSAKPKLVQIERNAKGNLDFLFISKMQPIFGEAKVANK